MPSSINVCPPLLQYFIFQYRFPPPSLFPSFHFSSFLYIPLIICKYMYEISLSPIWLVTLNWFIAFNFFSPSGAERRQLKQFYWCLQILHLYPPPSFISVSSYFSVSVFFLLQLLPRVHWTIYYQPFSLLSQANIIIFIFMFPKHDLSLHEHNLPISSLCTSPLAAFVHRLT